MPRFIDDRVYGTINVYSGYPDAFDEEEVSLLAELAGDIGFAVRAMETEAERKQAEESNRLYPDIAKYMEVMIPR